MGQVSGDDGAIDSSAGSEFVLKGAQDGDAMSLTDEVLVEIRRESHVIGYRRVDTDFQAVADLNEENEVELEMRGRVPPKGRSELATASTLIRFLNETSPDGDPWDQPSPPSGHERGVDAVADSMRADGKPLEIQVTVAERLGWRAIAQQKVHSRRVSVEKVTEELWAAIGHKAKFSGAGIVLAIDAGFAIGHAFDVVAEQFRSSHGVEAAELSYEAIYLVGPTANSVWRLDSDAGPAKAG
jgi:hypothetical protein